ncbi:MAG: amidohydrolase [Halarsenatibacteraceae bacterium]
MHDRLFYNCNLRKSYNNWENNAAFLVKNGRIVATGDKNSLLAKWGDLPKVDLNGQTVTAGFNDSHLHLYQLGKDIQALDLSDIETFNQLKVVISEWAENKNTDNTRLLRAIRLHDQNLPDGKLPDRNMLDSIINDRPLVITRACYHAAALNSKALQLAEINKETEAPESGRIGRFKDGRPDGRLYDSAIKLLENNLPEPDLEKITDTLASAGKKLIAEGITSIGTDDLTAINRPDLMLAAYNKLIESNHHSSRLWLQQRVNSIKEIGWLKENSCQTGKGDYWKLHGPLKIMLDGSLGAKTAALSSPYSESNSNYGDLLLSENKLIKLLNTAASYNFTAAIHVIGDRALDTALNAMEKTSKNGFNINESLLIHCQITRKEQLSRLGRLKMNLAIQPAFVATDWSFVEDYVEANLARNSYAWKSLINSGACLAGSSDAPIEPTNPLWGIQTAITRQDKKARPNNGWRPAEKLKLDRAWDLFTRAGAVLSGEGHYKGNLKPGQLADFVVLSENPFNIPAESISELEIEATYQHGIKIYSASSSI